MAWSGMRLRCGWGIQNAWGGSSMGLGGILGSLCHASLLLLCPLLPSPNFSWCSSSPLPSFPLGSTPSLQLLLCFICGTSGSIDVCLSLLFLCRSHDRYHPGSLIYIGRCLAQQLRHGLGCLAQALAPLQILASC